MDLGPAAMRPVRPATCTWATCVRRVLAWLFARSTGRRFLLRIEDLDASRVRPGMAEQQLADLAALGLDFDGEPGGAVPAAARRTPAALAAIADRHLRVLLHPAGDRRGRRRRRTGCSRYPGTCRNLTDAERAERRRARSPALRLRADGARQTVHDLLHGEVTGTVDDFVVRRNDGGGGVQPGRGGRRRATPAWTRWSAVTTCCRRRSTRPISPTVLGAAPPTYAHVPLAVNAEGRRLAKRDGAVTLADLAALGVDRRGRAGPDRRLARPAGAAAAAGPAASFDPAALPRDRGSSLEIAPDDAESAIGPPRVDRVRIPGMQANTVGG